MNYKIGGCDVRFPHQAYGTQLSFMSKVIQALEGGQNALLEAPTGSGKTLSLLCASLAWQLREKQRIEEGLAQHRADMAAHIASLEAQEAPTNDVPAQAGATTTNGGGGGIIISDPITGTTTTTTTTVKSDPDSQFQINLDPTSPSSTGGAGGENKNNGSSGGGGFLPEGHPASEAGCPKDPPHMNQKPPQIYYATRTHSQIAQVVAELKRSGYTPRMAVLGSKQHYCVNSHAKSQKGSIEQACDDLLKESQCQYFKGVAQMLNTTITRTVHDIEDLCKVGKRQKGCPYYVSRRIAEDAELVFAPYNYLVDPVICRSIGIKLESSIIIFDEAHNIEDVSREAASLDLERFTVMESLGALKRALQYNNKPQIYQPLCTMLEMMLKWMDSKEQEAIAVGNANRNTNRNSRFEQPYEKLWQAAPMLAELISLGLGPDQMESLWTTYQLAREEDESMAEKGGQSAAAGAPGAENKPAGTTAKAVRVGAGALGVISRLIQVVRLVHEESTDGGRDFRLVVKRESMSNAGAGGGAGGDAGIRARLLVASSDAPSGSSLGPLPDHFLTFSLWCLNPAVAFRKLEAPAHSIILTSGTLSPMDSFASELGTNFPIKLEAPHVVNMVKQVWAGAIGTAPSGEKLLATYHYTDKTAFQDAVGNTVLQACRTIPDGLLLFLPSYGLLDKLCARWKVTGCYSRIDQIKPIVREPRTGGGDALQQVMAEYYAAIASGRGGLFMAVCRGKVSEGLDFADANARGVIVVGIPFPAFKDAKVEAKRKFNDAGQRTLGLLSGSVWYDQQAFRALNQAVGRCIRHRGDWGAIILMDERFQQAKYQKGLSRWLRGAIAPHANSQTAFASMEAFFTRIQADPPAAPVKLVADPPLGGGYGGEADGGGGGGGGGGYKNEDEPKVNALAMLMAGHKAVTAHNALSRAVKKEEQRDTVDAAPPYQRQPTAAAAAANHTNNNNNPNSLFNVVRRAPLRQIIPGELAAWTSFAQNRGGAATEIDAQRLALEGMFEAFSLAKNAMNDPTPVHMWLHHAYVAPPWGIQAVLSLIPYQLPPGFAGQLHVDAVSFAGCSLSHVSALEALHAMKDVYEEILVELYPATFGSMMLERQQQREQRQPNFDYGGAGGGDYGGAGFKRKWEEEEQQQHQYQQIQQPVNVNVNAAGGVGNAAKQAKELVYEQALLQSASAIAGRAINSLARENIRMINHSAPDPMEAHAMLLEERREWEIKQEMMRDRMRDQYHWQNNAEEYDLQLQRYYQQRWQHQQQCVRLNQILYGINHPMGDTHSHPAPPSAQPMAISPLLAPRNPLQVQNNNPSSLIFNNQKIKKRAAPHDDDNDFSAWAVYNNNNNQRTAKRHHQ